jgi:hypothetical protein
MDRALGFGPRGCGFESCQAHMKYSVILLIAIVLAGGLFYLVSLGNISRETPENVSRETNGTRETDPKTLEIKVFRQDTTKINEDCGAVVARTRTIPHTLAVADASLRILFDEYQRELKPHYLGVKIENGVAIVNFKREALQYLNGPACLQTSFKAPIAATLQQFPTIQQVEYAIDGQLFTEWDA